MADDYDDIPYWDASDTYDRNYTTYETNDANEEYTQDPIPFSRNGIFSVCGIVTNLGLLIVLLFRLVKDKRNHKTEKVRWAKRHVLIILCAVHVLFLTFKTIMLEGKTRVSIESWVIKSASACRFVNTLYMTLDILSLFYVVVIAFITLLQTFVPNLLIDAKLNRLWLIIHVLIWSSVLVAHGIFTTVIFDIKSLTYSQRKVCTSNASNTTWIWYNIVLQVLPISMLFLSAVIAGIGYVCIAFKRKATKTVTDENNSNMLNWIIKNQFQAILFLFVLALFTCVTYLPIVVLYLMSLTENDAIYYYRFQPILEAVSILKGMFRLLFPLVCLILDDSWVCASLDKCVFKRGGISSNVIVQNIELDEHRQEQQRLTSE